MIQQVADPAVEVHDLTVTYHKKPVLWDIDLTLPKGSIIGIIGPNGAGKSTLIKAMMNLVPHGSGYVRIFNQDIDDVRNKVSYVPQKESVDWDFPASVMDVVLMGRYARLGLFKRPRKADKEVALDCLRKVGMEAYRSRQIAQLSGGQQQRVFLARALAQEAEIYFMDEPFAGVDAATEKAIIELMREMSEKGKTVVVIHHDIQSALEYFNWIVLLNMRLVASGPTEQTLIPSLLEETYGGKLTLLAEVGNLMQKTEFTGRDKR